MSIQGIVLGRLATEAVASVLPSQPADTRVRTPLDHARDRLARAKQMAETLDAVESYGVPLALLLGGAVAFSRK